MSHLVGAGEKGKKRGKGKCLLPELGGYTSNPNILQKQRRKSAGGHLEKPRKGGLRKGPSGEPVHGRNLAANT